ncbi:hypothetical protein LQE92_07345 [Lacrimispora sp. NSJ-141]|uniref:Uncharacterized protein n=2 Tax=Lachnospiraceae TaxID=186803 RepID=A0A7G9G5M3_9FIRM|nr:MULTISPECIES: hypothetical protein [Lachnospiraceae]MCD2492447.1 hypothetical protein [Lientehia hominis]QNM06105.1 hypothetical protein H9Q78_02795 [Qiania dongpingensis]
MKYGFEVEAIQAKKGKLPREERNDIAAYITTVVVEAEEGRKAFRRLASQVNGRLSRDCTDKSATITLPDYSSCQVMVRLKSC